MATRKAKKKKEMTDAQVFKKFGIGSEEKGLRKIISGQRRVNGRLYKSIELILDAFPKPPKKAKAGAKRSGPGKMGPKNVAALTVDLDKLAKADKINEKVPGDGPGCVGPRP